MYQRRVGDLYHPDESRWPPGHAYYYDSDGHHLDLFRARLSMPEVEVIRRGELELALFLEGPTTLVVLHRFPALYDWADTPYNFHLDAAPGHHPPPGLRLDQSTRLLVTLVNADTGRVAALRRVVLATGFSQVLHIRLQAQARYAFDFDTFDREVDVLYRRYPTPTHLAAQATHFCCIARASQS
jgi:hypothetical protein